MLRNGFLLFKSEFKRLIKYQIIPISFGISLLWMVAIYFIGEEGARIFGALFIALDASVMSLLMIGASLFFEREENTLKPLLVTPISIQTIITVKILSTIYIALQSAILVSLFVYFVMGISLNFLSLILFVSVIATVHALIGFYLSMTAKDFTGFLVNMIAYTIVFAFPTLLIGLSVLPEVIEPLLMISPLHLSTMYLNTIFNVEGAFHILSLEILLGTFFMMLISGFLFYRYVKPNYGILAVKE